MTLRCCEDLGDAVVFGFDHPCEHEKNFPPKRESLAALAARAHYVMHGDPDNLHPYEDNLSADERSDR